MSIVCAEVVHSYTHSLSWDWCITMIMTLCVVCESKIYMAATHMTKVTVKATILCYTTHSPSHITLSITEYTPPLTEQYFQFSRPHPKTATCTLSQHTYIMALTMIHDMYMYLIPTYSGSTFVAYTKALHAILRVGQGSRNKVRTRGEPGNEATILPRTVHMPHTMYCNGCTLLPCQQL